VNNRTKHLIFVGCWVAMFIIAVVISGCVSEGMIKEGSKGVRDGIIAGGIAMTALSVADKSKINAETVSSIKDDTIKSKTLIARAENTWFSGLQTGMMIGSIFWLLLIIGKYVFDRLRPKTIKITESTKD